MSVDEHDNHGQTPAAWTLVILVMLGFLIGSVAVVAASVVGFVVGVAVIVLGCIVGKVMQMMATDGASAARAGDSVDAGT